MNPAKLAIPSQSELLFGGKDGKICISTKIGHFKSIQATSVAELAIVGHFELLRWEMIQKVANLGKLANVAPPPPTKILNFCEKQATLVGNDWKSCESGKIGHSESI